MRILICGLETETNTFAPWPTGTAGFRDQLFRGDASVRSTEISGEVARLYRDLGAASGHDVIEGLFAYAAPSGPTIQQVYEAMRDEIVDHIAQAGPIDIVLLLLHGAMVSSACDDCEGDILGRIRTKVGPETVIGAVLDPHAHLSERMAANADILIFAKYYPHDDYLPRGRELFALAVQARSREISPVTAVFDCRMVGFYPTTREPMIGFVQELLAAEHAPNILSVSLVHGFPWGDTHDNGSKVLVVADGDRGLAAQTAERLGRAFYNLRSALLPQMPDIEAALRQAASLDGLVVLADTADNAGGGAPGDNTALLRAMLDQGVSAAALGCVWDPIAAAICAEAGQGARLAIRLGGKSGPASSDPIDLDVTVRGVVDNHSQTGLGGARTALGRSVWLDVEGVAVVVTSTRAQVFHPDAFTGLGIDISALKLIAVKSSQHFMAGFGSLADHVITVATPGAVQMNFADIAYAKRRDVPFFPRHPDPLSVGSGC
jgi:microcystin degradation protein MlrC